MTAGRHIEITALPGIPIVQPGCNLIELLSSALSRAELTPQDGDVLVVAQKVVSKAENRLVDLHTVDPSPEAERLASELDKDPRLVEVILSQTARVVRAERGVLIVEHRLGLIMANAGVDQSNVDSEEGRWALLLPADPDRSAEELQAAFAKHYGAKVAVIINDSFGRPWRLGVVGVAIGAAGLPSLIDKRGEKDLFGRPLEVTTIAFVDEIAAAASLIMGQADEGLPVVLIRGLTWSAPASCARSLLRPRAEDLFQ